MTNKKKEETAPLISMRGITKSFPGVLANDQINFDVRRSEIHALLGENGAGKSTLMKILYGFYRADNGEIIFNGEPIAIHSPQDARTQKIGMVFQDFTQIPAFTILENIALFLPDLRQVYKQQDVEERIGDISKRYGLSIDPNAKVAELSVGEQQKVEILKLLISDAQVLILDEPTRVLAPHEIAAFFDVLSTLREDGYAIIMITHKMREVLDCSDRITVLRGGKVAGSIRRNEANEEILVEMMFSKQVQVIEKRNDRPTIGETAPILKLSKISTQGEGSATRLKNIDLDIFPGEIVGVAGVSGNGQKELGDVILGMEKSVLGKKQLFGQDRTNHPIGTIRRDGVGFIPESPLLMASVPFMTVLENLALTNTWRYSRCGGLWIDWDTIRADYLKTQEDLGFTFPFYTLPRSLSGGNLQRMVIVREMTHNPDLLIASYLTRGLDVQSTQAARKALIQASIAGAGVLLISEDLDELLAFKRSVGCFVQRENCRDLCSFRNRRF